MAKREAREVMMDAMSASMEERTGRTVEQWIEAVDASGIDPLDQLAVRRWLRDTHGVPQNSQWTIADAASVAAGWERPDVERYIDSQYQDDRAALRPIFDELRGEILAFGDDVAVEGRSTYTPFVRRRQFAAVAAATRTRIDVGLRFTDAPESPLLNPARAPGQATHKLSLTQPADVSPDVIELIRIAYLQND